MMRLAIASPNRDKYSETFIQLQMDRLPCSLRVFGRPVAAETDPGGAFSCHGFRRLASFGVYGLRQGFRHGFNGACGVWQAQELKRRLRRSAINVLLANYGPTGVALQPICAELSIPMVVHFHGYDAHLNSVVAANIEGYRELGRSAARILAVSEFMRESLVTAGIPRNKIRLIRYGVEPTKFRCRTEIPHQQLFLGVGRFVDKKAPNLTVMAFNEVHRRFPKSKLVMAGDGVLLESTRNLATALGLGEAVEFPGTLTGDEVAQRMLGATAFVQHSVTPSSGPSTGDCEGTPVAVLEAMMSGLPIVATRHAGINEVIKHGRNGFLVEERDVKGMSEAMIHLAELPEAASAMGRTARADALEFYSAEAYADELEQVLQASVNRKTRGIWSERQFDRALDRGQMESVRS